MIDQVNLIDSFKLYKKTVEQPVDKKTYAKITGEMYRFMIRKALEGHDVELSGGQSLGTIGVRGTKGGNLKTDWKHTYALWNKNPAAKAANERIYHLNDHSSGVTYHFYWWVEGMKIGFKRVYSFKFAKGNKRMLKKMILEGYEWLVKPKRERKIKDNGQQVNES